MTSSNAPLEEENVRLKAEIALLQSDATARQRGKNPDGSVRRETVEHGAKPDAGWKLSDDDVQWVVNDNAELGVKIGVQFFWLYKGESLIYREGTHDDGRPMRWRRVYKREFGECCHPINMETVRRAANGGFHVTDIIEYDGSGDEWANLPPALDAAPPAPPREDAKAGGSIAIAPEELEGIRGEVEKLRAAADGADERGIKVEMYSESARWLADDIARVLAALQLAPRDGGQTTSAEPDGAALADEIALSNHFILTDDEVDRGVWQLIRSLRRFSKDKPWPGSESDVLERGLHAKLLATLRTSAPPAQPSEAQVDAATTAYIGYKGDDFRGRLRAALASKTAATQDGRDAEVERLTRLLRETKTDRDKWFETAILNKQDLSRVAPAIERLTREYEASIRRAEREITDLTIRCEAAEARLTAGANAATQDDAPPSPDAAPPAGGECEDRPHDYDAGYDAGFFDGRRAPLSVQKGGEEVERATDALNDMVKAADYLSICAETSGGVAGRDDGLVGAVEGWVKARDRFRAVQRIQRLEPEGTMIGAVGGAAAPPSVRDGGEVERAANAIVAMAKDRGIGRVYVEHARLFARAALASTVHFNGEDDPFWLKAQLTKLLQGPSVCLCDLSGEFSDISKGGCEVCAKASGSTAPAAGQGDAKSLREARDRAEALFREDKNATAYTVLCFAVDEFLRSLATHPAPKIESPRDLVAVRWTHMPAYGEVDFQQLAEAVNEATVGDRHFKRALPLTKAFIGHEMTGINFNSLNRIVSAFVRATLDAAPAPDPASAGDRSGQDVEVLRADAQAVCFHYFCCGDDDGCGQLRPAMADLARSSGFEADPGTNEEIAAIPMSTRNALRSTGQDKPEGGRS